MELRLKYGNENGKRIIENLNTTVVKRDQIHRLQRIVIYLEELPMFPTVQRRDKTRPNDTEPYNMTDVLPPDEISFGSINVDWEILNSDISVAFIGTTAPSQIGSRVTRYLCEAVIEYANDNKKSCSIVGGGVTGIDKEAQELALCKCNTISVIGNPVKYGIHPYTPHRKYYEKGLLEFGGLVSQEREYSGGKGLIKNCMKRHKMISALSDIVVLVESNGNNRGAIDNTLKSMIQNVPTIIVDYDNIDVKKAYHSPRNIGNKWLLENSSINNNLSPKRFPPVPVTSYKAMRNNFRLLIEEHYTKSAFNDLTS